MVYVALLPAIEPKAISNGNGVEGLQIGLSASQDSDDRYEALTRVLDMGYLRQTGYQVRQYYNLIDNKC